MSLLEHPTAQALLDDATLTAADVQGCQDRLTAFLQRYLRFFYRKEQCLNATRIIQGHLSDLKRKTCEPIAIRVGCQRKPLQDFVGNGRWDDEAPMAELRCHVREQLADPNGILILDGSGFPKKGSQSCGVKRQWCGRLGKEENCQVGVFLAYATAKGYAPLDRRLYLPKDWCKDRKRRKKTHVPKGLRFKEKWRLGLDLLDKSLPQVPHAWVVGDDEFGRVTLFRKRLRQRQQRYVLDVPCNTLIRDLEQRRRPRRKGKQGRKRQVPFRRACTWVARLPADAWQRIEVREGEKGPLVVQAVQRRVQTKVGRRNGPEERLLVTRTLTEPAKTDYSLVPAGAEATLAEIVRVRAERHQVEELLQAGKGEVGLAHYEVRSWIGWHHHMTLALLALWFLILEKLGLGEKKTGGDGVPSGGDLQPPVAGAGPECGAYRLGSERSAPPQ
jgi:SRSO17 transposase